MVCMSRNCSTAVWLVYLPLSVGFAFFISSPVRAQVTYYEGNAPPETDAFPWTRYGTFDCQRWVDNGIFYQLLAQECCPTGYGQNDGYKRTCGEFTGSSSFFVTWREMNTCPRTDIGGNPAGVSVWSSTGHDVFAFKITSDQVEFARDNPLAFVMDIDAQPGVLHTYYLALHTDLSYTLYIDGAVVNFGHYPSPFPNANAQIQWWARYYNDEQTARWDYIRYGVIPTDHSGDFDSNGVVDSDDLYFFLDCLLGPDYDASGPGCRWADMNGDGIADGRDVQLLCRAMIGG